MCHVSAGLDYAASLTHRSGFECRGVPSHVSARLGYAAAAYQVDNQHYQRNYQQQMNQAARYVKAET